MISNRIHRWWNGYAHVRITGPRLEPFINSLMTDRATVWDIVRHDSDQIELFISLPDFDQYRERWEQEGYTIEILQWKGIPNLFRRLKQQIGMMIGVSIFVALLLLLPSFIWDVQVVGIEDAHNHEQMEQVLDEVGLYSGAWKGNLLPIETMKRILLQQVSDITWVGIHIDGTHVIVQALEKTLPEISDPSSPRHLVASKKAVVQRVFVDRGQPLVKPNDYVQKGDILVSGIIGNTEDEEDAEQVAANGSVYGEVWYEAQLELPITTLLEVVSGDKYRNYAIQIGEWQIPVWGFWNSSYEREQVVETPYYVPFIERFFSVGWRVHTHYDRQTLTQELSSEDAFDLVMEHGREQLVHQLPPDSEIVSENVLKKGVENGKVYMKIHITTLEEITSVQYINQGE